MRQFLSAALLAAPLAVLAQPASAQYFGNTSSFGNSTYGTVNTPYGSYTVNTQRIGNTIYSNAYGDDGSSATCTMTRIGNSTYTNCY